MVFVFQLNQKFAEPVKQTKKNQAINDMCELVEQKTSANHPQEARFEAATDLVKKLKTISDSRVYASGLFSLGKFISDYDMDPQYKDQIRASFNSLVESNKYTSAESYIREMISQSTLDPSQKSQMNNLFKSTEFIIEDQKKKNEPQGAISGLTDIPTPVDTYDYGQGGLKSSSGKYAENIITENKFNDDEVQLVADKIRKQLFSYNPFGMSLSSLQIQHAPLDIYLESIRDDKFDGSGKYNLMGQELGFSTSDFASSAKFSRLTNAIVIRIKEVYDSMVELQKTPGASLEPFKNDQNLANMCKYLLSISRPDAFTDAEKKMLKSSDLIGFVESYASRSDADAGFKDFLLKTGKTEVLSSFRYKVGTAKILISNLDYIGKPGDESMWFLGGAVSLYSTQEDLNFRTSDDALNYEKKTSPAYVAYNGFGGFFIPSLATWLEASFSASEKGVEEVGLYLGNRSETTGELGKKIGLGDNWGFEWAAKGNYALKGKEDQLNLDYGQMVEEYLTSNPAYDPGVRKFSLPGFGIGEIDLGSQNSISKSQGSSGDYSMDLQIGVRSPVWLNCIVLSTDIAVRASTQEEPSYRTVFYLTPFTPALHKIFDANLKVGFKKGMDTRSMDGFLGADLIMKLPASVSLGLNYQYLWQIEQAAGNLMYPGLHSGEVSVQVPFETVKELFK